MICHSEWTKRNGPGIFRKKLLMNIKCKSVFPYPLNLPFHRSEVLLQPQQRDSNHERPVKYLITGIENRVYPVSQCRKHENSPVHLLLHPFKRSMGLDYTFTLRYPKILCSGAKEKICEFRDSLSVVPLGINHSSEEHTS